MGRMIFRRTCAFLLAVVMAVAFVGIFAGNANANPTGVFGSVTVDTDVAIGRDLSVTGATTTNGITNTGNIGTGTLDVTGATTLNGTLGVTGATTVGGTLDVTGATTVGGTLDVTGNLTADGAINTIGVAGVSNNNLWGYNTTIVSTDGSGNNAELYLDPEYAVLGVTDFERAARLLMDKSNITLMVENSIGEEAGLFIDESSARLGVRNPYSEEWHGLQVYQDATVLSGGTNSTSLTLDDNGATFRNETTGGPARVTGVADGRSDFDAVNWRQLKTAYSGIASVAALAAIPEPVPGKNFALGVGYGNFEGENAIAAGIKARIPNKNISFTVGAGVADDKWTTSAGFGVSF